MQLIFKVGLTGPGIWLDIKMKGIKSVTTKAHGWGIPSWNGKTATA